MTQPTKAYIGMDEASLERSALAAEHMSIYYSKRGDFFNAQLHQHDANNLRVAKRTIEDIYMAKLYERMNFDILLKPQPVDVEWSNSACLGYAILGAKKLVTSEDIIAQLIRSIRNTFDSISVRQAAKIYNDSDY
jgi:hypothetical protein